MIKTWALPIAIIYLIALTVASLVNIGGVPELGSQMDDKIYHVIAYALLMLVLYNYMSTTKFKHPVLVSSALAVVYGIILEVFQQLLTASRVSDPYDVMANAIGVVAGVVTIFLARKLKLN